MTAEALVPNIVSISYHDVGSITWVDITVNHAPPPAIGPSHYVSNILLEVNGTIQDLPQSPQSTETFIVSHSLGSNSNKYSVRALALCNQHGYSNFSGLVVIPEFRWKRLVWIVLSRFLRHYKC